MNIAQVRIQVRMLASWPDRLAELATTVADAWSTIAENAEITPEARQERFDELVSSTVEATAKARAEIDRLWDQANAHAKAAMSPRGAGGSIEEQLLAETRAVRTWERTRAVLDTVSDVLVWERAKQALREASTSDLETLLVELPHYFEARMGAGPSQFSTWLGPILVEVDPARATVQAEIDRAARGVAALRGDLVFIDKLARGQISPASGVSTWPDEDGAVGHVPVDWGRARAAKRTRQDRARQRRSA